MPVNPPNSVSNDDDTVSKRKLVPKSNEPSSTNEDASVNANDTSFHTASTPEPSSYDSKVSISYEPSAGAQKAPVLTVLMLNVPVKC